MKTLASLLAIVLVSTTSASIRRFIVKNDVFMGTRAPEFCMDYFESSSAKLKTENIDREVLENAIEGKDSFLQQEEYFRLQNSIQNLAESQNPEHICDSAEFAPTILSADYQYTCLEICQSCIPGSTPICYQRSPRYPGLAQVCLCTYDLRKPVENAAFSIRHEKRVFSRKIRRT